METAEVSNVENVSDEDQLEGSQVQEVIGLLLTKPDAECNESLQVDFPLECKSSGCVTTAVTSVSSLNVSHVTLADTSILLDSADAIQHSLDENSTATVQLGVNTTPFIHNIKIAEEPMSCDVAQKFTEGEIVKLESGETAFLSTTSQEGFQQVQLSDGTIAYISSTANLFDGETSDLGLEQLSSQITVDNDEKDIQVTVVQNNASTTSRASTTGDKAFHCPYEGCNRLYTTQHHLKVHERSHTGDRPFKCIMPNCGKAFATGYGLKSHTRVHTGETPYRCTHVTCTKAFKTSGDLQKHIRTHTGERPFKCPFDGCDRAFTTSNIRKVHIRIHTGERPYVCEVQGCRRAFSSATNFKNHIRIHTGEKPYKCSVEGCNKRFTEYSSLYKHHVVHTHTKPYVCNLCGKNYRQTSTLAMHKRMVHGITDNNEEPATNGAAENDDASSKCDVDESQKFQSVTNVDDAANIIVQSLSAEQGNTKENAARKLPTIVALQTDDTSEILQERPLYAVQLQDDGTISSAQQILVVTNSDHLAVLQQLAQHAQLQSILTQTDPVTPKE